MWRMCRLLLLLATENTQLLSCLIASVGKDLETSQDVDVMNVLRGMGTEFFLILFLVRALACTEFIAGLLGGRVSLSLFSRRSGEPFFFIL